MRLKKLFAFSALFFVGLAALPASAFASAQCPAEFGPKDPMVNALGWLVVAVGVILGALLFAYGVRRSRAMRPMYRYATLVLGLVGMVLIALAAFAIAFVFFFFKC